MSKKKWNTLIEIGLWWNLTVSFILFTVIGTVSHEFGHLAIGKLLGFKGGQLHYASAYMGNTPSTDSLNNYYKKFRHQLKSKVDFPERKTISYLEQQFKKIHSYILWGGPFQSMLTGTIGLIVLIRLRRKKQNLQTDLTQSEWLWILIALFWLRQTANCLVMIAFILLGKQYGRGDETRLSKYYDLPPWTLNVVTGAIGTYVLYYVIFNFIPPHQRFTFILAGLVGGVSGYILWLHLLGPIVLP